ncbi:MAG: serpin family protein [Prevotella sp.]|nr:serpin family protein [Prevotella sp.]
MKANSWAAIALTLMVTTTVGCSSDSESPKPEPVICPVVTPTELELTSAEQQMVGSSNDFAFNLFREVQDEVKSQIVSPVSITYALGMLNNGAAGETQKQINSVLGFADTGSDGINAFCYKMLQRAATLDPLTKVLIANTIYMNKPYELQTEFVQRAKTFYDAEPETRDFHDGKTRDVINKWGSDHTEGMIEEVLKEGEFDYDAVSYLLNAIYFKGSWKKKFDKAQTMKEPFDHAGITKEMTYADMMHQTTNFEYAETDDCQALRLPYGNGSFQMTVLLPKAKTNALPKVPTAEVWQQLNEQMDSTLVNVSLPRFETDTDIDLKPIMTKLGMPDAFNPFKADFRNFCNTEVYIELMKQVAKIKVDEEGTEAAAVTVIGVVMTSIEPEPQYVTFHANHPFLYVISEQQTGAVLFIGQYTGY